jgi:hypothetical protein
MSALTFDNFNHLALDSNNLNEAKLGLNFIHTKKIKNLVEKVNKAGVQFPEIRKEIDQSIQAVRDQKRKIKLPVFSKTYAELKRMEQILLYTKEWACSKLPSAQYSYFSTSPLRIKEPIIPSLQKKIDKKIFAGANEIKERTCQKLEKAIQKKEEAIRQLQEECSFLKKELKQYKRIDWNNAKEVEKEFNSLKSKSGSYFSKIKQLLTKQEKIRQYHSEFIALQKAKEKIKAETTKAAQIRAAMKGIGGENITIDVRGRACLDGMYFSAEKFKEELRKNEIKAFSLQAGRHEVKGWFVEECNLNKPVLNYLNQLSIFRSGITPVMTATGHLLMMRDEDVEKLLQTGVVIEKEDVLQLDSKSNQLKFDFRDINATPGKGTVLLTSGNMGTYEKSKREILAFLLYDLDVMAFNPEGYGKSTGSLSGEKYKEDMLAAYDFIKKKHPVEDEKILLKALCLSGGPAAYLAGQHPGMHLALDQTYSKFSDVVAQHVAESVNEVSSSKIKLQKLLSPLVKGFLPKWNVKKSLTKVEGKVGIIHTSHDEVMPLGHVQKNLQAMKEAGKVAQVSVYSIKGEHADSWLDIQEEGIQIRYKTEEEVQALLKEYKEKEPALLQPIFTPHKNKAFILDFIDTIKEEYEHLDLDVSLMIEIGTCFELGSHVQDWEEAEQEFVQYIQSLDIEQSGVKQEEAVKLQQVYLDFLKRLYTAQGDLPLISCYREVLSQRKNKTANELYDLMDETSKKWFKQSSLQSKALAFLLDAIQIDDRLFVDPSLARKRYPGRTQMKAFLSKCNLLGNLLA